MNLFDNIFNPVNSFLGKQAPQVPVSAPVAPRTANYTQPIPPVSQVQKPSMTLFSDEQQMFQKMKADNLPDEQAFSMLKKRRADILGGNDITAGETEILKKMQADAVPVKQAVEMIQKRRKDQFEKKYQEANLLQKGAYNTLGFAAGNLETIAKYGGNTLDFITGGTMGFGDEVKKMEQVTQSPEFDSMAFKAGTYLPDVALAVSPIGGGYLAGAKGMTGLQGAKLLSTQGAKNLSQGLMGRSAVVGAGFGGAQPILEQGSDATMGDIATGAGVGAVAGAVATPVISKALKYGQAGYRGGLTGMGKSISRDIKGGVQAITPSGANISTRANRFNALDEQKFIQATKQTPGEFATSRGMTKTGDDAVTEATNLWQASKEQADKAFGAIQGKFRIGGDKDFINGAIEGLQGKLSKYSPEIERVNKLALKYQNEGLTMSEVNELKRLYASNHKYSFLDSGSKQAIESRDIQDGLRGWQFKVAEENGLTNISEINKTTQAWKMYADSLAKKQNRSVANNANSLTDWIVLGGGSPENIALYLGKKLASSDTVKRGAIKLFSKQTKPSIIEANIADIQQSNFQKNVNRGVSPVGDSSGGKSMVRPVGLLPAPSGKATGAKNFRVNQPKEKTPLEKTTGIIRDPRVQARNDYLELKSLEESLMRGDEPMKAQARVALGNKVDAVRKKIEDKQYQSAMSQDMKRIMKDAVSDIKANFPDGTISVYNKLNGILKRSNKGTYNDIEGEMGATGLKREFADATNAYNNLNDTNYSAQQFFEYLQNAIGDKALKSKPLSNESKVIKPTTGDTIPEGYTKNAFGEIIKKPGNKKGGFIRIGSEPKKYSPEGAIKTYTNSSDKINKMLREGKEHPQIEALDKFLIESKKYDGTVYRGLTVDEGKYNSILENIRKNGIKDKAYTSTTENYGDATTYARNSKTDGKKGIMFEIESKNGRVIDKKYNAYDEEEILFPRNTKFEYVGEYNDVGRGLIIKLKEKTSPKKLK